MRFKLHSTTAAMLLAVAISAVLFTACDNNNEKVKKDVDDLQVYAREHRDSVDRYLDNKWDELDRSFEDKRTKLEKDTAKMGEEIRANYRKAVQDWEAFKNDYSVKAEEKKKLAEMDAVRNSLAIEGIRTDYTDLAAAKVVQQYRHFVQTVETNKDTYTKDQWTAVNVNWKALNARKREVSKDISRGDEAEIMKLQLKYTGIKAINRPTADKE